MDVINPKVSVVIPVYNGGKFITTAITSVLEQKYNPIEVVVVDDCSTDDTLHVLNFFAGNITVLTSNVNRGASHARNKGIKYATGDYIAFLDADDIWFPNKLNRQISALAANPGCGFSYGLSKVLSIKENYNELLNSQNENDCCIYIKTIEDIFLNPYFSTSTIIINKKLCDNIGFFREDLKTAEDIDFCLKAAVKSNMIEVSAPLSLTRRVKDSLGSVITSYQDNLDVLDGFLTVNPLFLVNNLSLVKCVKQKIFNDWLSDLVYQRRPRQALRVFIKLLKTTTPTRVSFILLMKAILLAPKHNK
jgi:glycosyltransferase involved in cell wall biosynthesis